MYEKVKLAIARLKRNKSPGVDGISTEMIKAGGNELVKEIHKVCEQVWNERKVSVEWTKSILVTVPKKEDRQSVRITNNCINKPCSQNINAGVTK